MGINISNGLNAPPELIRNKKFLILAAIAILAIVIFLISAAFNNKKKSGSPVTVPFKEKTMDEIINDLTAPAKDGKTLAPVSNETMKSLTVPVTTIEPSATPVSGSKNKKTAKTDPVPTPTPTPSSIPKDVINSLTAPVK